MALRKEWKNVPEQATIWHNGQQYLFNVLTSGYDDPGYPFAFDAGDSTPPEFELNAELVGVIDKNGVELAKDHAEDLFEEYYDAIIDDLCGRC